MINLIQKELKEFFSKKNIVIIIIVSICFLICTYYVSVNRAHDKQATNLYIGVVDEDDSTYSRMLVNYFTTSEVFSKYAKIVEGKREAIEEKFYKEEVVAYLVIPDGFVDNLMYIENTRIEAKISSKDTTTAIIIKNVLTSYEKYISAVQLNAVGLYNIMEQSNMSKSIIDEANTSISIDLVMTALDRTDFFVLHEVEEIPSTPILEYYFYGILSVILLYIGLIPGFRYRRELRLGTLDRLRIIGNSNSQYIITQLVLFTFLFGGLMCLLFKSYEFIRNENISIFTYILMMVFVFFSNSFGLLLATLCNNSKTFLLTGNLLYLFSSILGGVMIPIMFLPESFLLFSRGTVNYWFIKLMIKIQNNMIDAGVTQTLQNILVISLVLTLVNCLIASKTTRKETGGTYE